MIISTSINCKLSVPIDHVFTCRFQLRQRVSKELTEHFNRSDSKAKPTPMVPTLPGNRGWIGRYGIVLHIAHRYLYYDDGEWFSMRFVLEWNQLELKASRGMQNATGRTGFLYRRKTEALYWFLLFFSSFSEHCHHAIKLHLCGNLWGWSGAGGGQKAERFVQWIGSGVV